jgi:tRNA-Thr(GGU) m(6)t(6)A37 methyltransferase TsaA
VLAAGVGVMDELDVGARLASRQRHTGRVEDERGAHVPSELPADHAAAAALHHIRAGQDLLLLTWLHLADRDVLQTHPRGDPNTPLTGVFATRSPDRPNPIGLQRVTVTAIGSPTRLHVRALEAIDGTPILDLKAVMDES